MVVINFQRWEIFTVLYTVQIKLNNMHSPTVKLDYERQHVETILKEMMNCL